MGTPSHTLILSLEAGLAATALVALCALGGLIRLWRELGRVRRASKALANGGLHGLDQLLREQDLHVRQVDERAAELERRLWHAEGCLAKAIRRVHVHRFNPFRETGGDQSFVIALLDGEGSGLVITGLHTRAETRLYAKPIQSGGSRYPLSEEEIAAIRSAVEADAGQASR